MSRFSRRVVDAQEERHEEARMAPMNSDDFDCIRHAGDEHDSPCVWAWRYR